jgi:hypothetical protein
MRLLHAFENVGWYRYPSVEPGIAAFELKMTSIIQFVLHIELGGKTVGVVFFKIASGAGLYIIHAAAGPVFCNIAEAKVRICFPGHI